MISAASKALRGDESAQLRQRAARAPSKSARRARRLGGAALAVCLALGAGAAERRYAVPLLLAADSARGQGFLRILNASNAAGSISIRAFDDAGEARGPVRLTIAANGVRHFNSADLEQGNPSKGLAGATGAGAGDWRLALSAELDLVVLAFVRTAAGFLASMHDAARGWRDAERNVYVYPVRFFNRASNTRLASELRVANVAAEAQRIDIVGRDDAGASSSAVSFRLAANAARTLTAQALETGAGDGLNGRLGDGDGKWELYVSAPRPLQVMSLVTNASGRLANLSSEAMALAPRDMESFQARTADKQVRTTNGATTWTFAGASFTQRTAAAGGASNRRGSYRYSNIGPRSGLLQWTYEGGVACAISVIFAAQTRGRLLSVCSDGQGLDVDWELADAPAP